MPGEVLMALAQFAGQTVAAAAITDMWEAVRGRFARLLGSGDARRTQVAEQWLAQTHDQLTTAPGAELEQLQTPVMPLAKLIVAIQVSSRSSGTDWFPLRWGRSSSRSTRA